MTDTDPKTQEMYRKMLLDRSPAERFKMGFSMFQFSKKLVENKIRNENPEINGEGFKEEVLKTIYPKFSTP